MSVNKQKNVMPTSVSFALSTHQVFMSEILPWYGGKYLHKCSQTKSAGIRVGQFHQFPFHLCLQPLLCKLFVPPILLSNRLCCFSYMLLYNKKTLVEKQGNVAMSGKLSSHVYCARIRVDKIDVQLLKNDFKKLLLEIK